MYKTLTVLTVFLLLTTTILPGCQHKIRLTQPDDAQTTPPITNTYDAVRKIPKDASKAVLQHNLKFLLKNIQRSRHKERRSIEKSFRLLQQQPRIVSALMQYYNNLPRDEEETLREELKLLNKYNENH